MKQNLIVKILLSVSFLYFLGFGILFIITAPTAKENTYISFSAQEKYQNIMYVLGILSIINSIFVVLLLNRKNTYYYLLVSCVITLKLGFYVALYVDPVPIISLSVALIILVLLKAKINGVQEWKNLN